MTSRPRCRRRAPGALGVEHGQPQHGGAGLRAVDQRSLPWARARPAAGRARRASAPERRGPETRFALADEDKCNVRERGEVAARADRAARGHDRMHAGIEQRDERVERLDSDAGVALREHIRTQRHDRAHDRRRQRFADARGVAAQQIQLEAIELVGWNRDVGQRAEAGVHAVDGAAGRRMRVDDRARPAHAVTRRRSDVHALAVTRDVCECLEGESAICWSTPRGLFDIRRCVIPVRSRRFKCRSRVSFSRHESV